MEKVKVGVIGGSGLYDIPGLTDLETIDFKTPFGEPSDAYRVGTLNGVRVAFLPRHGQGHRILPSELNFRANILGFKTLGVEQVIGVTAVGSLREDIRPTDMVIPDQLFDRTQNRVGTYFGEGVAAHIPFADPFCGPLRETLDRVARKHTPAVHRGGTLICIEGPAFSTRAESRLYRQWGMDIIGMTTLQEAKLAREAEICYAALALVTDYDCWHEQQSDVTVGAVVQSLERMTETAKTIIAEVLPGLPATRNCACSTALENAIMTAPETIPGTVRRDLEPLLGKYLDCDC